jgi:cysteine dioxygenase
VSSIRRLQRELHEELERDPRGRQVARLLSRYAAECEDWRRFALFAPEAYARNLVHTNELYEMMVVCWGQAQESPIHNHAGQQCWMAVLEGHVEETHYDAPLAGHRGALRPRRRSVFAAGGVAYIDDGIALHKVRPADGGVGVTLHVYSRPIETCQIYDEQTGAVRPRRLCFHSVEGLLVGG